LEVTLFGDDGRREEVHLDEFFEMSLDHLVVAGFDGYFKRLSPAWTRTFGWTVEELLSRPSIEFVHPEDREATLNARNNLRNQVPLTRFTNRYLCKDGSHRWLEWKSNMYPDRQLVYAVARDVTAQRQGDEENQRIQKQLMLAERMASIGRLASGVAHEVNNPLAFVLANLVLARDQLRELGVPSSDELEELLSDALQGAERVRKIVLGLKTFSRVGDERAVRVEVGPAVEVALALLAVDLRRAARVSVALGPTPFIDAPASSLSQVVVNLLRNATEAIAPGNVEANEIRVVTATDAAGRAVIEIHDTGSGIPPKALSHIFDPFFTTKPIGTGVGLGLSVCHNLVAEMGGEIAVTSEEGRGSTFRVTLPPTAQRL
jgi:PAS domain S-box-containing protein